jgi:protein involved in polysaccharide export with SLBB domain
VEEGSVPGDYVIGPGDQLSIRIWGQIEIREETTVNRKGQIFVPRVGPISLAGVKYSDLKETLKREVGRVFHNFDASVSLTQLRTVDIFVLGNARRPGRYTISSLSTLVNALFASGGPSNYGSMRNIQLKREGKVISNFDLYDLLVAGDKSKDVPLLSGDVIYMPAVGPQVAIAGSINVPAIYEIRDGDNLGEVIRLGGGLSSVADGQQVTMERIVNRSSRTVETISLGREGLDTKLQDGDLIRITSIVPRFDNAVTLRGNVANPGRFPWKQGMRISDLVPNKGMLLTRSFWSAQNRVIGGCVPENPVQKEPVPKTPVPKTPAGQLGKPARIPLAPEQISPLQELTQACSRPIFDEAELGNDIRNASPQINWDYALVQRLNPVDLTTTLIPFNLGKVVLQHDPSADFELQPGDILTIFSQKDVRVPQEKRESFVRVEGEVWAPGVYKIMPGDTLRSVIRRAGGVTSNAYLYATEFTRESARREQQRVLDQATRGIESEMQRRTSAEAGPAVAQAMPEGPMMEQLKAARASGRIVLQMRPSDASIDAYPDIVLEDGDRIIIPYQTKTVSVLGAVYNQSGYLYHPGLRVRDYVRMAGNGTQGADFKHLMVVRADGSTLGRSGSSLGFRKTNLQDVPMLPGDTVVVPTKISTGMLLKNLQAWTQIGGQLAIAAASLAVVTGH